MTESAQCRASGPGNGSLSCARDWKKLKVSKNRRIILPGIDLLIMPVIVENKGG
jgi:hypothetical protein